MSHNDRKLRYRTRNDEPHAGKPRVFVCYRHVDANYLEPVVEDLLSEKYGADCAVWYDHMLTAGESYNPEILAAIDRSDLCVIIITENTFERGKYVYTTELPHILKSHKPILPIIVSDFDAVRAEQEFVELGAGKGINFISRQSRSYGRSLRDKLERTLLSKDQDDQIKRSLNLEGTSQATAEDNYWIGLAYLYGRCGKTVDMEKAMRLIKASAETGYAPAMRKTAELYIYDQAENFDLDESEVWQKKYIAKLEEEDVKDRDYNELKQLYDAYEVLGWIYSQKKSIKDSEDVYVHLIEIAEQLKDLVSDEEAEIIRLECCWRLGRAFYDERDLEQAEQYLAPALNDCIALYKKIKDGSPLKHDAAMTLIYLYLDLGRVYEKKYMLDEAKACYSKGIQVVKQVEKKKTDSDIKMKLVLLRSHLGDVMMEIGDLDEAENYYSQVLYQSEQAFKSSEDNNARYQYAYANHLMGNLLIERGRIPEAKAKLEKALEHALIAKEKTDTPGAYLTLAKIYGALGMVYRALGDSEFAENYFQLDIDTSKQLVEDKADTPQFKRDLGFAYQLPVGYYIDSGKIDIAKEYVREAKRYFDDLRLDNAQNVEILKDLCECELDAARISLAEGKVDNASEHLEKSAAYLEDAKKITTTPKLLMTEIKIYGQFAQIQNERGDFSQALKYMQKDYDTCVALHAISDTVQCRRLLSAGLENLGFIKSKNEMDAEAEQDFLNAVKLAEETYNNSRSARTGEDLARILSSLTQFYIDNDNGEEAEKYVLRSINLRKEMLSISESFRTKFKLGLSYKLLGMVKYIQLDPISAQDSFIKAMQIFEELNEAGSSYTTIQELCVTYGSMAQMLLEQNQLVEAKKYAELDMRTAKQLQDDYKDSSAVRGYCKSLSRMSKILIRMGEKNKPLRLLNTAIDIRRSQVRIHDSIRNKLELSKCIIELGNYYSRFKDMAQAEKCYNEALEMRLKLLEITPNAKIKRRCAESYYRLGDLMLKKSEPDPNKALDYFNENQKLLEDLVANRRSPKNVSDLSVSYNRIGDSLIALGRTEEAYEYYTKSLGIVKEVSFDKRVSKMNLNLIDSLMDVGTATEKLGKQSEAEKYYLEALEHTEELRQQTLTQETADIMVRVYNKMDEIHQAKGDPETAQYFRHLASEIDGELNNNRSAIFESLVNTNSLKNAGSPLDLVSKTLFKRSGKNRKKTAKTFKAKRILSKDAKTIRRLRIAVAILSILLCAFGAAIGYGIMTFLM